MDQLKRKLFETLLGLERSVFVYLDPRVPEVVVPSEHKKSPVLTLQIGLNLPIFIPLVVEDDGFVATLSFARASFKCEVPWTSVFAIVSESDKLGRVFEEDVPAEIRAVRLKGFGKEDGVVAVPVSRAEPRPPEELVDAQQDRIHPTSGQLLGKKHLKLVR